MVSNRWYFIIHLKAFCEEHNMIIGEHIHTLDTKRRISLPAKFRKEIGKKVFITNGLDDCLFIYSVKQWNKVLSKIEKIPMGQADGRSFSRFILGGAVATEVDSIGRVLIPDFLKMFAGLNTSVAIVGMYDRIEIWDEKKWRTYRGKIEKQADTLAEKLGDIGAV